MKKLANKIKNTFSSIFSSSKGFTLLELLVVVLIIGILASIALPQYQKSVEKARVMEAIWNIKAIEESVERYKLANGNLQETVSFDDVSDIELSGGEWNDDSYYTKYFQYYIEIQGDLYMEVYRKDYKYILLLNNDSGARRCFSQATDIGRYICKYLESQGWEYRDYAYI